MARHDQGVRVAQRGCGTSMSRGILRLAIDHTRPCHAGRPIADRSSESAPDGEKRPGCLLLLEGHAWVTMAQHSPSSGCLWSRRARVVGIRRQLGDAMRSRC